MATCFLFTQYFNEEHCLSLRFDQQGQLDAPLALRPIHEIRALQSNARTIVVLPTQSSSLHEVELPLLGERKARAALPYALEEQLAQNVTTLHFSFDRQHYQHHRYLVVVTDRQLLLELINKLTTLQLHFDSITIDWFALHENEACITETGLLVRDKLFKGALNGELATIYLNNEEKTSQLLRFQDSVSSLAASNTTSIEKLANVWIAERLLQSTFMNLCQGELEQDTHHYALRYWYQACGVMLGVLIGSVIVIKTLYLHSLNTKLVSLDEQVAVLYREFFPDAKQVVSPRFRINQLLATGSSKNDTTVLWTLLDKLAQAFDSKVITIEQFRFQNRILSVTLLSNDFAALEKLQQHLQQDKLKVTQSQASSREHKVAATLELTL